MRTETARKVFLSHTRADKDFARHLATDLETLGFAVWFDKWELRVGDSLIERIEEGIQESQWMVVILSPAALKSEWVLKELRTGLTKEIGAKKVFVLPALCQEVSLPSFLQDKFYADFTGSYETGLSLIKDRLLGQYKLSCGEQWLLIKNPLPEGLREELSYLPESRRARWQYANYMRDWVESLRGDALPRGSELWFGRTGRLVLRSDRERVFGDYDWHGMSLAGRIEGRREKGVIIFNWDWRVSSERGNGLFWTTIPNVLHGGWWMDYDDVDQDAIRAGRSAVPNRWEFVNVQGLRISAGKEEGQGSA